MFENLSTIAADPILGLNQVFLSDDNPDKINLSIGVYQDASGMTPIFSAVKQAESELLSKQQSKTYMPQAGDPDFNFYLTRLLLGEDLVENLGARISSIMTPGGCGALRMGAELLVNASQRSNVWVSDPTWANHYPLLESAGLTLSKYRYYDEQTNKVDFQGMLESVSNIPLGDVILLHGCCHNPTGADITNSEWDSLLEVIKERNLIPFIDIAYQGLR